MNPHDIFPVDPPLMKAPHATQTEAQAELAYTTHEVMRDTRHRRGPGWAYMVTDLSPGEVAEHFGLPNAPTREGELLIGAGVARLVRAVAVWHGPGEPTFEPEW